jgi:signal peptidase II
VPFDGEPGHKGEQAGEADAGEGREGQADGVAEARRPGEGVAVTAEDGAAVTVEDGAAARLSSGETGEDAISDAEEPDGAGENAGLSARRDNLGHA